MTLIYAVHRGTCFLNGSVIYAVHRGTRFLDGYRLSVNKNMLDSIRMQLTKIHSDQMFH